MQFGEGDTIIYCNLQGHEPESVVQIKAQVSGEFSSQDGNAIISSCIDGIHRVAGLGAVKVQPGAAFLPRGHRSLRISAHLTQMQHVLG